MKRPTLDTSRLKNKRVEKGWNKLEASQKMNIPQSAYVRYENGQRAPSYTALKNMALSLGTTVEYLTGQTDDDSPNEYLISASDDRLIYVIEMFNNSNEELKETLFKYAKKLDH